MASASQDNGKKWIQSSVAITCMVLGYILITFFETLSEWFELESKISNYAAISQVVSVIISIIVFIYIMKDAKISSFLKDVYGETLKVVWPKRDDTVRSTIGIMIGVTIVGFILGFFDLIATWALSLIN